LICTNIRPHAYEITLAAEAAGGKGKFWGIYDYLLKMVNESVDILRQSGAKLGLGLARFDRDFRDRKCSSHKD
jgi:hypothetical protein